MEQLSLADHAFSFFIGTICGALIGTISLGLPFEEALVYSGIGAGVVTTLQILFDV